MATKLSERQLPQLAAGKIRLGDVSGVTQQVTPSGDVTIDNAGVLTIGPGKVTTSKMAVDPTSDWELIRTALGSAILDEPPWKMWQINSGGGSAMGDNTAIYIPIWVRKTGNRTGVKWYQLTAGNYTSDNNNKLGWYSFNTGSGLLTQQAASADDGTMWKATGGTYPTKNFSSTYNPAIGLHFIALLYNQSAQTTAPALGGDVPLTNLAASQADFANGAMFCGTKTGSNDLPSTISINTLTRATLKIWVGTY